MKEDVAISHLSTNLTSFEMASLWNVYLMETMVHHMFKYFLQHLDDPDIKALVNTCHSLAKKHMELYLTIFNKEGFPIPRETQIEDVNLDAPRLFSDIYYTNFIKNVAKFALITYTTAFTEVTRDDIKNHFKDMADNLKEIELTTTDLMLSKGLYTRPPNVPIPNSVEFVNNDNFFGNFFDSKRPLSAQEITQIFTIAEGNALGKATNMAFSQIAGDKQVRDYFLKGKETAHKNVKLFNDLLLEADIPTVKTYDGEITESTVSPFSDRLMLFQVSLVGTAGIGNYGLAVAQSQRKDVGLAFLRLFGEAIEYASEGAKLMVEKGWMEQSPLASDRDNLIKKK
ncbi:spore coat protein CotF [Evansella vedderi]|uniref:Spore coat protein CotF n=1 Tax=Evansella vedderi TaxID=38282 RepID=A0ABU0A1K3_9BACI|nr:DUF3231 family protein [Evansella vedderi]MDQ0257105.1 spore coat protein CotF [Evansella vedderi]